MRTVIIADPSGSINLSLWGAPGELLKVGDVLEVRGAYANTFKGGMTLYTGKTGAVRKIDEYVCLTQILFHILRNALHECRSSEIISYRLKNDPKKYQENPRKITTIIKIIRMSTRNIRTISDLNGVLNMRRDLEWLEKCPGIIQGNHFKCIKDLHRKWIHLDLIVGTLGLIADFPLVFVV